MLSALQASYLRLFRRKNFPHASFARLTRQFGTLAAMACATDGELTGYGLIAAEVQELHAGLEGQGNRKLLQQVETWLAGAANRHLVCYEEPAYPPLLRETASPPPLLFIEGNLRATRALQVALVGSRSASHNGARTANWLAVELARAGYTICSGLAAGIDTQAHVGALTGGGDTIAVLGTGVDLIYPAHNRSLAERIRERGALVSELPLGSPPRASHFPQRNRIIAGLSIGVVVVEAALRSGSLITARLAMEENREVFAVPGSIHTATARGCHKLIRDGAKLVDSAESIMEELGSLMLAGAERLVAEQLKDVKGATVSGSLPPDERRLMELIGFDPCTPDELIARLQKPIGEVNRLLASLELRGLVEQQSGRYRCLGNGLQQAID